MKKNNTLNPHKKLTPIEYTLLVNPNVDTSTVEIFEASGRLTNGIEFVIEDTPEGPISQYFLNGMEITLELEKLGVLVNYDLAINHITKIK